MKTFVSIFIFCFVLSAQAKTVETSPFKWSGNIYKIIHKHKEKFDDFSKSICNPKDAGKYWKLLKAYRGNGHYLPKVGEDIDRRAIKKNLHHFEKKSKFIDELINKLSKTSKFPKAELVHSQLDKTVSDLLSLKKAHQVAMSSSVKEKIRKKSAKELLKLKTQFKDFLKKIYFLKSYHFPNNFLDYRERYEALKDKSDKWNKKQANEIFFFRKIVEDGAYDPNHSRPDRYVRTALDTLYLNITKEKNFISEVVRFDLEWIEKHIGNILKRGRKIQLQRLGEWKKRTSDSLDFYREVIKTSNKKKAKFLVKKENESAKNLVDYVYKKQAEVYEYWAKEDELSQALFSLETIMIHEVGVIDGDQGIERSAVANVAINRYYDNFYNQLKKDQRITKFISPTVNISKHLWLNLLFKTGEFSFTYHYIPAVAHIFCPDMSKRGKSIRAFNLKLALKALKDFDGSFKAFRYFSRISMPGKIDMSSVWTDYERMPEMVAYKSKNQNKLVRYFLTDKYEYFYSFKDSEKIDYTVLRINDQTYSMRYEAGKPVFYDYRSPHLFRYFSKKN